MSEKLLQINKIIEDIIKIISNDTLLLILGDHGSTDDGNHGGNDFMKNFENNNTFLF